MFFSEPHVGDATPGYPQERKKIEPYQISSCNPTPTPRLAPQLNNQQSSAGNNTTHPNRIRM